jgi:hypothetical protein
MEKAAEVQKFVKGQLEEAQKRWQLLEGEAKKVASNLVTRGQQSRKELEGLINKLNQADLVSTERVKLLSKKAVEARGALRKRLDGLQTRVIEAAGVASQSQVKAIGKELSKLSRKLDALVGKKGKPDARA